MSSIAVHYRTWASFNDFLCSLLQNVGFFQCLPLPSCLSLSRYFLHRLASTMYSMPFVLSPPCHLSLLWYLLFLLCIDHHSSATQTAYSCCNLLTLSVTSNTRFFRIHSLVCLSHLLMLIIDLFIALYVINNILCNFVICPCFKLICDNCLFKLGFMSLF